MSYINIGAAAGMWEKTSVKQTEQSHFSLSWHFKVFLFGMLCSGIIITYFPNAASVFGQFVKSDIEHMWRPFGKCSHDIYAWKVWVLQGLEYFKTERSLKPFGLQPQLEYGTGTQKKANDEWWSADQSVALIPGKGFKCSPGSDTTLKD